MDKYRIRETGNSRFPYEVQKRRFFFWWVSEGIYVNRNQAYRALRRLQREG